MSNYTQIYEITHKSQVLYTSFLNVFRAIFSLLLQIYEPFFKDASKIKKTPFGVLVFIDFLRNNQTCLLHHNR
jgi:hypothetical protein